MSDNFHKFLFLGVMIAIVIFANHGDVRRLPSTLTYGNEKIMIQSSSPPIFVLKPIEQISNSVGSMNDRTNTPSPQTAILSDIQNEAFSRNIQRENILSVPGTSVGSSQSFFSRVGGEPPPEIGASIAFLADLANGESFFSFWTPGQRWPLASISKLISAAVVSRNIPLNQSTTLAEADFPPEKDVNSLKVGERYNIGDLRFAMLVESSNEAAEAIANSYSRERFIEAMNSQIKDWGLADTYFDDPTGLSASNQSTAADLLQIARHIYGEFPEILKITKTPQGSITELNSGKKILIKNINNFAGRADFLGGKTGYTDEAGGNLLSLFSYEKRPIFIIVLGSEDRFGDTEKLLNWFERNYK